MALEIEIKLKVEDHDALRRRLKDLKAEFVGEFQETNTFYDTPDRALLAKDSGLRLRRNRNVKSSVEEFIMTYKGPRQPGAAKTREEIEMNVSSDQEAAALLRAIGFEPELSFEKRRESWTLGDCKVELDELSKLGKFVEIEGPSEQSVTHTAKLLNLENLKPIESSYIAMLMEKKN